VRRRIVSVFLLLLFSLGLTVPAALALSSAADESPASAGSKLPPCCRKDGKHRCGMAAAASAAESSGLRMASAKCREYPRNGSQAPVSFSQQFCLESGAAVEFPVLAADSAAAGGAEDALFVTRLAWRVSSKRGPPSPLSRS
jgi:hypothetical protein